MNIKFTIGRKLSLGFGILLLAIFVNGVLTFVTLKRGKKLNDKIAKTYTPSIKKLKDLNLLVIKSKTLITSWLEDDAEDTSDKIELIRLHGYDYPELRRELKDLITEWEYVDQIKMDSVFNDIDSLYNVQHDIMIKYQDEDDYWYPSSAVEERTGLISSFDNGDYDQFISKILVGLKLVIEIQSSHADSLSAEMKIAFDRLQSYVLYLGIVLLLGGGFIAYFTIRSIVSPVTRLKEVLITMGKGILPASRIAGRNDEIGEMSAALNNLVDSLKRTSNFSKEIGEGNFNSSFEPLSEEDILGNSLIIMRDNLALVAEEDKKRNWTTEGLARFGEILRTTSDDVSQLSRTLIAEIIKYLEANQGGVFVKNSDDSSNQYMELTGCFAWDRIKYLEQKVYIGEGLVGQAWQERTTLYITDIPEDYIKITSGLGDANPTCLLIVPMLINDEVLGVIEIASFDEFEEHQIKFVEKLAESTATTISSVRVNQRTKKLLEQFQVTSEEIRRKEEELNKKQEETELARSKTESTIKEYIEKIASFERKHKMLQEEKEMLQNILLKTTKELDRQKND